VVEPGRQAGIAGIDSTNAANGYVVVIAGSGHYDFRTNESE
jgi:hypothetical protein